MNDGNEVVDMGRKRLCVNGWDPPDCYQRLEFFIQVLRVLCPNLTDASYPTRLIRIHRVTERMKGAWGKV